MHVVLVTKTGETGYHIHGEALEAIRRLTDDHRPPEDACGSYRALYAALAAVELDLHQHIHLESNVLFPRALDLEQTLNSSTARG